MCDKCADYLLTRMGDLPVLWMEFSLVLGYRCVAHDRACEISDCAGVAIMRFIVVGFCGVVLMQLALIAGATYAAYLYLPGDDDDEASKEQSKGW